MIDYELYCKIKDYHQNRHLNVPQIARELSLDERTVSRWLNADKYRQREIGPRPSKLDPFKPQIIRWLETHPYTATQIYLRLRDELSYKGGVTVVRDYVCKVRPRRAQGGSSLLDVRHPSTRLLRSSDNDSTVIILGSI